MIQHKTQKSISNFMNYLNKIILKFDLYQRQEFDYRDIIKMVDDANWQTKLIS